MTLKVGNSQASHLQSANLQQNRAEKIQTNTVAENEAAINHLANSNLINQSDKLVESADKTLTVGDFLRKIKTEQPFDDAALSKKQVKVFVSVNKPRTETTLTDYDKATWRAIFKKAGYGMLTDQELALAVGGMNAVGWTVNDSKFDLENLRKEDAKPGGLVVTTNQAMIERTTRAAQAVLQFREYQSLQADAKKRLAESQTNQMLIDPFRLGGNAVVRWGERILNTPRDISQQIDKGEVMPGTATAKRIGHAIAEKMTGQELAEIPSLSESVKQNTGIELPAIPEITLPRPFEYQSEKYQREGQIGEDVGATAIDLLLLKRGIAGKSNSAPQSLKDLGGLPEVKSTSSVKINNVISNSPVQSIKNRFPNESPPKDGRIIKVTKIENGKIETDVKIPTQSQIDFIVNKQGELILGKRHSFLSNGMEVQAAGTMKVFNGKVRAITNLSGHYQPTVEQAKKYPEILRKLGLDLKNTKLEISVFENTKSGYVIGNGKIVVSVYLK